MSPDTTELCFCFASCVSDCVFHFVRMCKQLTICPELLPDSEAAGSQTHNITIGGPTLLPITSPRHTGLLSSWTFRPLTLSLPLALT